MPFSEERLRSTYFDLLKIPSVTGSEEDIARYVAGQLETLGLAVTWVYPDEGTKWPSLMARMEGTDPNTPSLLLIGHLDTVAVTQGWRTDPFVPVVEGDRVYALGACDMKGGLAAILETVRVLMEEGTVLQGTLHLAFASDEEGLSRGSHEMLRRGLKADMAIMAECRFQQAAIGFRGRYGFLVHVDGISAHASRYPHVGENALISASRLAIAIEALETADDPYMGKGTWCIRHIQGGIRDTLSVPDRCELFVDRYVVPGETAASCAEQIGKAAEKLGIGNRVRVELAPRNTPYMEGFRIPEEHPLVSTLQEAYERNVGRPLELGYDPSVCDSNYLVVLGNIPTVTFGPSGEGLHGPNEYGSLREISQATAIYLDTVRNLLA
jgi:succinyl-diaminopimelate desuccinylase